MTNRLISMCKNLGKPVYNIIDFTDDYLRKNIIQDKTDRYEIVMNMKEGYDGFVINIQIPSIEHSKIINNLIQYLKYNHNKKYLNSITVDEPIISTNNPMENSILYHISSGIIDCILVYVGNDKNKLSYFLKINCNNTKVVISEDVEILLSSKLYFNVFVFYNENISNISDDYVIKFIGNIFECKYLVLLCCRSKNTKIKILI